VTTSDKVISNKESIWLDENSYARINPKNGAEFDEADVERHFGIYLKLGLDIKKRQPLLVDATCDFEMTKGGRELSAKKAREYFTVIAVISNSFTTRLLINFLNSFYSFGIPLKMFANEDDAMKWLKEKQHTL